MHRSSAVEIVDFAGVCFLVRDKIKQREARLRELAATDIKCGVSQLAPNLLSHVCIYVLYTSS